jgi:hypothetical protein
MIPEKGQYFTVESLSSDGSYEGSLWRCIDKNDSHILCREVGGVRDKPLLLSPKKYDFFDAESFASEFSDDKTEASSES